jgi:hypothetical protein
MKAIGAVHGAIIGPKLLVALVMAVYPRVSLGSWDLATPVLTILFAATLPV